MKCSKCGTELREGAKFCKSCGSEVKVVQQVQKLKQEIIESSDSNRIFTDIMKQLSVLATDYSQKVAENAELKKANEIFILELKEKDSLISRQNEEISELNNNADKLCLTIEELKSELEAIKQFDSVDEEKNEEITSCPKCGSKVDENTIFCGECGTRVR